MKLAEVCGIGHPRDRFLDRKVEASLKHRRTEQAVGGMVGFLDRKVEASLKHGA